MAIVLMRGTRRLQDDVVPEHGLEADLFALDATVIELSMALFPFARWKESLASVKLNMMLVLNGGIPTFASLHERKMHEVASLDGSPLYPGGCYVMDRGYLDFERLHRLHKAGVFFVTRLKANTCYYVSKSRKIEQSETDEGLRCDQMIKLNSWHGEKAYP